MMMMFDEVSWFNKILRPFFAGIDQLIYSLIAWVLEGIFELSNITASNEFIRGIYNRVYVVLSLFMLFKISFSFIQYMINPDSMSDKEKGVAKMITNVVIMLCMLVAVPILFFSKIEALDNKTFLEALQDGVLQTLPRIILGIEDSDSVQDNAHTNGQALATAMLKSFYYPAVCDSDNEDIYSDEACKEAEANEMIGEVSAFKNSIMTNKDGYYTYQYVWPMTTISGVFLVIILLGIAIDVAIRVFKLLILQVMAPVPIMSYIDPKSSKDGAFSHWSKSLVSTYLDIFFKIGIVYIVLMLISEVFKSGGLFEELPGETFKIRTFIKVFLAIGLFKFAKDAPKFIKDALGMKDNGNGGGGFMGKAMSGLLGAGAGFLGGMATGGIAGGLSGLMTGAASGAAGKPGEAYKQVRDEQAKLLGKTPGGMKGKLQNKAMQRSVMRHTGLGQEKLDTLKEERNKADNALVAAEAHLAGLTPPPETGDPAVDAAAKSRYAAERQAAVEAVQKAKANAAKAGSAYSDASSLAKQIGLKKGFMEENKRHGSIYVAAKRAQRAVDTGVVKPATSYVSDRIEDISSGVEDFARRRHSEFLDRHDQKHYTDPDLIGHERRTVHADKELYKDALRGGIGNNLDADDLQSNLRRDKQTFRDDKKTHKKP